jgi:hypothetical protein
LKFSYVPEISEPPIPPSANPPKSPFAKGGLEGDDL